MQNNSRNFVRQAEAMVDEIDLRKIIERIKENKWFVMAATLTAFLVGVMYVLYVAPVYKSVALIQVDNHASSTEGMQEIVGTMASTLISGTSQTASPSEIEIALINSRFVLQPVIEKLNLNIDIKPHYFPIIGTLYARYHQQRDIKTSPFGLSQFPWGGEEIQIRKFEVTEPIDELKLKLIVAANNEYDLYNKEGELILHGKEGTWVQSKNPVLNLKLQIDKLKAQPGNTFTLVRHPLDEVIEKLALNLNIKDLGNTKDKSKTGVLQLTLKGTQPNLLPQILNTIVNFALQNNINKNSAEASKTLEFLNKQLPMVHKKLDEAESNLNEYRARGGLMSLSQEGRILLTSLTALEKYREELRLKKIEMLQEFTHKHPFLVTVTNKQEQVDKEIEELKNKVKMLPKLDQRAISLERDVRVKSQLYLVLLNKIQQLQIIRAGTLGDIRVLTPATIPIQPLPNNKLFILMTSPIAGFLFALMFLFVRELLPKGINNPEIVEERLGIASYAYIPYSRIQSHIYKDVSKKYASTNRTLAQQKPNDPAIEAIRNLRTSLQFTLKEAKNNIVSIMGASPNIGKSFISTNLSQVLADTGKRVLLIDADMRKGKTHLTLGQNYSPGLSEILMQEADVESSLRKVSNHFYFIPRGNFPKNPSELLLGEPIKQLLQYCGKQFDLVLIDTPPLLAVTDAVLLAHLSATNLLVIGSNTEKLKELEWIVRRTRKNGIDIHGLVFNHKFKSNHHFTPYVYYQENEIAV